MILKSFYISFFLFCLFSLSARGQGLPVLEAQVNPLDSSQNFTKTDSLTSKIENWSEMTNEKASAVSEYINEPDDSATDKISALQSLFRKQLDSLQARQQLESKLQKRLDSLGTTLSQLPHEQSKEMLEMEQRLQNGVSKVPGVDTLRAIRDKGKEKINAINESSNKLGIGTLGSDLKPDVNSRLPALGNTVPDISNESIATPDLITNNVPTLRTERAGNVLDRSGEIEKIQKETKALGSIAKEAGQITKHADEYAKDVKSVQKEGLTKSEKLPELAEQQALKIDEVKELQQKQLATTGQLTDYQKLIEQYKNEKAIEAEMNEKVREVANDVIAQQQSKIDDEIKKTSNRLRKFSEVQDIRNLPRHAPNPMKGQGWRDRVIPGFTMQTLGGTSVWVQLDPQVYYKLNGNWSAGIGGLYRFSMNPAKLTFDDFGSLYGLKAFVQRYFFKSFFLRVEGQQLNWKPWNPPVTDPNNWDKTYVASAGLGKSFFLTKKIRGSMQTLYHFTWGGADPYKSKIMIRFGFDFSLKKKEIKPWQKKLKELKNKNG